MRQHHNVDANERILLIRSVLYSSWGAGLGLWAGGLLFGVIGSILGGVACFAFVFLLTRKGLAAAGSAASIIYHPSGDSTPPRREYSRPQALMAQGHYEEAVNAYEACTLEFPEDPEPYLQIARLYRNELQRFEDALSWFKKARAQAKMTQPLELLITQEIVEVYTHKLATPRRAIPELARLAERFPETEAAQWARHRLQELRAAMVRGPEHREEHEG
jgi:tetratricopeptide (TPR) repeat protein